MKNCVPVNQMINELSEAAGSKRKQEILSTYCGKYPQIVDILKHAYDPFKHFWFYTQPETNERYLACDPDAYEIPIMFDLLENLRTRVWTGNAAKSSVAMFSDNHPACWASLSRILAKDLKCGIGIKTINKVFKQHQIETIFEASAQLASREVNKIEFPCRAEWKYDGFRIMAVVKDGEVTCLSRSGKQIDNFIPVAEGLLLLPDAVYDGEVIGDTFVQVATQARRINPSKKVIDTFKYIVWDILSIEEFEDKGGICNLPLSTRCANLHRAVKKLESQKVSSILKAKHRTCKNRYQLEKFYKSCINNGAEGIVVKDLSAGYKPGRNNNWIKIKPTDTMDLVCIGTIEGRGKYQGSLGCILVESKDIMCSVGTGFTDAQREDFWKNPNKIVGKTVEVAYQEVTEDGSLRFPVFRSIRNDL